MNPNYGFGSAKERIAMLGKLLHYTTIASTLSLPMLTLLSSPALAGKSEFWVYNNTNADIIELYVSESTRDSWDADILNANQVLASGNRLQVDFSNPSPNACLYDILAVFADGQVVEDYQVNVCSNRGYNFREN